MKIAVVTAIFGGVDTPKPFPEQSVPCDYYCFTEENSPVPLPNLPDRLKAKYFKLQMHRVLRGYDAYVWIDGNIEVTSPDFVKAMTDGLSGIAGIRIQRHHERDTIGEEIEFILASENPYLTARYGKQPLREEYNYYLNRCMTEDAPLYSCNIFAHTNTVEVLGVMDWWFSLVLQWSWFDQSAFSFISNHIISGEENHLRLVRPINLGPMFDNPYFILHPHAKPFQ